MAPLVYRNMMGSSMADSRTSDSGRRRERLVFDPWRPGFHYLPPSGWMNDPNGAIYWNGKYHLFFQHNPHQGTWHNICWGHAVSEDLVHWTDLPVALAPEPGGPDETGCWSGCAVVHEGRPALLYHGMPGGVCLAFAEDDDLITWTKSPHNPVIGPPSDELVEWKEHAPGAWREDDTYYLLSGSHVGHRRGPGLSRDTAFLFRSKDLMHWDYMHMFYGPGKESDCACPDFFPLGDKHVLLMASHARGGQYYVGTYADHRLCIERNGRMNSRVYNPRNQEMLRSGDQIAPTSWLDESGRRIMAAWVGEGRTKEAQIASGWAGVLSLPRVLTMGEDDTLRIEPPAEFEILRRNHLHQSDIHLPKDESVRMDGVQGDSLEIAATFEPGRAKAYGLKVRCSPDGEQCTRIIYDPRSASLSIDVSKSSESHAVCDRHGQALPLELPGDELLDMRVFLDRSILEVFANGRQCVTKRIYPDRLNSLGVEAFATGAEASLRSLDAWDMEAVWPVERG